MNSIGGLGERWYRSLLSCIPLSGLLVCLIVTIFMFSVSGCTGTNQNTKRAKATPEWVLTGEAPEITGAICAVGVSGPTYFRSDGIGSASDRARAELARTVRVQIKTGTLDIQTERGLRGGQSIMEVTSLVNDTILEKSRIVEVWFDETGEGFARKPGCTYALACIDAGAITRSIGEDD